MAEVKKYSAESKTAAPVEKKERPKSQFLVFSDDDEKDSTGKWIKKDKQDVLGGFDVRAGTKPNGEGYLFLSGNIGGRRAIIRLTRKDDGASIILKALEDGGFVQ